MMIAYIPSLSTFLPNLVMSKSEAATGRIR